MSQRTQSALLIGVTLLAVIAVLFALFAFTQTASAPVADVVPDEADVVLDDLVSDEVIYTSDFEPPTGLDPEATEVMPGARRLLSARSDDGIHWTKTSEVITDQGDVPELVVDENGTLFLYYYGWEMGEKKNDAAVAISTDNGETWVYKYVTLSGTEDAKFADPDVLYRDGVFYLYGSQRTQDDLIHIIVASSDDGLSFTYQGVALDVPERKAGVASTYEVGDEIYMLSLDVGSEPGSAGTHWLAKSEDGITFTQIGTVSFKDDDQTIYVLGNVVDDPVGEGVRAYLFGPEGAPLRSWVSADGQRWELATDFSLSLDEGEREHGFIGEPDVVQLPDGTYFMAYMTLIP